MCAKVPAVVPLARSASIWQSGTFNLYSEMIPHSESCGGGGERNQVIGVRVVCNGDR